MGLGGSRLSGKGLGGGMYNYASPALITNCTFSGNKAGRGGGGIYSYGIVSPTLINCTFSRNVAHYGPYGGGMHSFAVSVSPPTVTNCIFWGNTPEQIIGDAIVTYSDVQGGWAGTGNIDADPCFVDINDPCGPDGVFGTWDDGLRLTIDSNCIDAADGNAAPSTDILGCGRVDVCGVDNNGTGDPNYADMGAYEWSREYPTKFEILKVLKISGGENHTLLIKADRTVWACGSNGSGQLGIGTSTGSKSLIVQVLDGNQTPGASDFLQNITEIDGGWYHSLAVELNGHAWAWGTNASGQIGDGSDSSTERTTPVQVKNTGGDGFLTGIVRIAAGRSGLYSLACDNNDSRFAWAWGDNNYGQLGNGQSGSGEKETTPVHVNDGEMYTTSGYLENIIDIDAGISHSIALDNDGKVWCWGEGYYGQLGNNTIDSCSTPVQVVGEGGEGVLADIVDIAVTATPGGSSYAVDSNGYVWAWGGDYYGQLGIGKPSPEWSSTPVQVHAGLQNPSDPSSPLKDIVAISAGRFHVLALDEDGNVWAWGYNLSGQLGDGEYGSGKATPVQVKKISAGLGYLTDIVYIDAGWEHSMAIDKYGSFWVWGRNDKYQLGLGGPTNQEYAQQMP